MWNTNTKILPRDVSHSIRVSLVPLPELKVLGPRWRNLQARARGSFFNSWGWIECWLRSLPADIEPQLLQAMRNGQLVGLAVLCRRQIWKNRIIPSRALFLNETGRPRFDQLTVEHNGILADRRLYPHVVRRCAEFLLEEVDGWDELYLRGIDRLSGISEQVHSTGGVRLEEQRVRPCYYVDLAALRRTQTAYLDAISANTRQQIRRTIREFERFGAARITPAQNTEEALGYLTELRSLHQAYWTNKGEKGAFENRFFDGFHRRLVESRFSFHDVQLAKITAGQRIVGYLYNFRWNGEICNYQSGFDYPGGKHLRPGVLSHYLAIEHGLRQGEKRYDFLAGDGQYKQTMSTHSAAMLWAVVRRDKMRFHIHDTLRGVKRAMFGPRPARMRAPAVALETTPAQARAPEKTNQRTDD